MIRCHVREREPRVYFVTCVKWKLNKNVNKEQKGEINGNLTYYNMSITDKLRNINIRIFILKIKKPNQTKGTYLRLVKSKTLFEFKKKNKNKTWLRTKKHLKIL